MASNPKLDSSSSSPYGVPRRSQRSNYSNNSNLERSGNNRDGHDGGRLGLGTGGVGALNTSGGGGGGIDLPPISQVLSLEPLTVGDQRAGRHSELKRAINAAVGSVAVTVEDPSLGNVQSRPLEVFGAEDLKRVKTSLLDHVGRARKRKRHLLEAITKLDRFRNSLQSRKRSRPESSAFGPTGPSTERSLSSLGVGDRTVASVHNMKSNSNAAPPHGIATADAAMQKAVDKNKRVVPNKRVRTSMADTRLDGRPTNVNLQRPSVSIERDRDVSRPSNSLPSPAEEKERVVAVPTSEGREKTKMKGRRSGSTTKPDPSSVAATANGTSEGEREHKWSGQQHRMSADSRSRPSEGHGFRSGPVHGITSVHKAESSAQINGLPVRGGSKSESEGTSAIPERAERASVPDRERTTSKNGTKPPQIREESHVTNPTGITKTKAARAPRSISFGGGGGPSSHLARSSSFADNRERHAPPVKAQVQAQPQVPPSGPTNRKRPAPSRSSSPPAQWVGQRPQKMARVARRVNLMPGAALTREEPNVVGEAPMTREGIGANASASARPSPGVPTGSGVARRVSGSSIHSQPPPSKPKSERATPSVGLSESDESEDESEKVKEKVKKQADWEQKSTPPSQKMACLVVPAKKQARVVTKEEGGDGVRRQGRSGRGAVAPRTSVVNPVEKVEVSATPAVSTPTAANAANAKQLRSVRVGPEKLERHGRPPTTKKDSVDRKPMTRPRRPVGNGLSEISGESDDDREEITNAIRAAVNASGELSTQIASDHPVERTLGVSITGKALIFDIIRNACSNNFWKQLEAYFAFFTAGDLVFLRQQARDLDEGDPALLIPACGALVKTESMISTPPVSPPVDPGGGKSMSLANGNIETDGSVKLFHNMKEKHEVAKGGKRGVSGGWFEKILPLSQRLLAALIHDSDLDDGRRGGEETCQDDSSEGGPRDESPFRSSLSGSERVDGDSEDGDVGRRDLERWNSGGREVYTIDGPFLPNGHGSRSGLALPREDLAGDEEDILAAAEADPTNSADQLEIGNGDEVLAGSGIAGKDDQRGGRSFGTVAGMTAWEAQYQRMSVDDKILLELQSIGLFPEPVQPDLANREDDEVSEEIRKMQRQLKEQVCANKERVSTLEKVVLSKKEKEERDREQFAVEKLVERAYTRRMGSRGSAGKSAAAKGAKTAGLAFAKRVLARVRAYDAGQSFLDTSLRDILFCVAPKEIESSAALSGGPEPVVPTPSLTGEALAVTSAVLQPPKPPAILPVEVRPAVRRTDVKSEKDIPDVRPQPVLPVADRGRVKEVKEVKEDVWPLRAKEREVLLEDVVGGSGMRDVNALGANVMGGTKGKRSERERDGKGHGKESHTRSDSSKGSRQEVGGNAKPERKTKTKPRQKTAPLSKAVNGLLAKSAPPEPVKDRTAAPSSSSQQFVGLVKPAKEEVVVVNTTPGSIPGSVPPETDDVVDLSNIPIPGIEDLGVNDLAAQGQDLGAWLQDFDEDVHMNTDGDCLMGLQVPMDDLSDLGLMM